MTKQAPFPDQERRISQALKALKKDSKLSVHKAHRQFDVPYRTLLDRKTGAHQSYQKAHEEQQKLTPIQETFLVSYAQRLDNMGIPARRDLLKAKAQEILRQSGNPTAVLGKNWIDRFMKRHLSLQVKVPDRLDKPRKLATTAAILDRHMMLYKAAVKEHNIQKENIWNMDEKGFMLGAVSKIKVICKRAKGTPTAQMDGSRDFITVLEAVSASGRLLPPYIIWKGKHQTVGRYIPKIGEPGTRFGCSPNGWTSNELAYEWLTLHYDPLTRPEYVLSLI